MGKNLKEKERETLQNLLHLYQDVFTPLVGLPFTKPENHTILLKEGAQLVNLRLYRYSSLQKDIVERMISKLVDSSIVQPSQSPFTSPVVLIKKKDFF
jgi:hypothetical protein